MSQATNQSGEQKDVAQEVFQETPQKNILLKPSLALLLITDQRCLGDLKTTKLLFSTTFDAIQNANLQLRHMRIKGKVQLPALYGIIFENKYVTIELKDVEAESFELLLKNGLLLSEGSAEILTAW